MARAVVVQWLGADQLRIKRSRRPLRLLPALAVTALLVAAVYTVGPMSGVGLALLTVGAVLVPVVGHRSYRAFRSESHILVRGNGRLLLDGEPLEIARMELRVLKHPFFRVPTGYALSLWALIGRGDPVDVEVGRFHTMVDASMLSGQLEEFLERAKTRAPGRLTTGD